MLRSFIEKLKRILGNDKILMLLIILFICKGIYYAFVIIPPTIKATPDDIGHLSYIQYIVSEKKLPVLDKVGIEKQAIDTYNYIQIGQEEISVDLYIQNNKYNYDIENGRNWIAQHPPLYYGIAAIVYSFCSIFTNNIAILILAIRCLSILLGVITLVYMHKTLSLLNFSKYVKYTAYAFVVFTPAIQYYFAAVNNDSLLICISAVTLYYLLDYIKSDRVKSFYIMVILCATIIWTKYTGGLIVLAYVIVYLHHVFTSRTMKQAILQTFKGALLGLALLLPLFAFNLYHYRSLFVVATEQTKLYDFSFLHYVKNMGYLQVLFENTIAFIGSQVSMQATDLQVFLTTCFILGMGLISYKNYNLSNMARNISLYGSFIIFNFSYNLKGGLYFSVCAAALFIIVVKSLLGDPTLDEYNVKFYNKINRYMLIMIIVVVGIFTYQHYVIGLHYGIVRATNGRYYYIILVPFVYILMNALNKLSVKNQKIVWLTTVILSITCEVSLLLKCIERWSW